MHELNNPLTQSSLIDTTKKLAQRPAERARTSRGGTHRRGSERSPSSPVTGHRSTPGDEGVLSDQRGTSVRSVCEHESRGTVGGRARILKARRARRIPAAHAGCEIVHNDAHAMGEEGGSFARRSRKPTAGQPAGRMSGHRRGYPPKRCLRFRAIFTTRETPPARGWSIDRARILDAHGGRSIAREWSAHTLILTLRGLAPPAQPAPARASTQAGSSDSGSVPRGPRRSCQVTARAPRAQQFAT